MQAEQRRFALLLEYDGTCFAGSQLQTNALTVQSVLEDAIERATGEASRASFAGRTDAGVHALGQVASFLTLSKHSPDVMLRALNAWLPDDVVVRQVAETTLDFDPRRDALRRHYRYVIDNSASRSVLERQRVWHVPGSLDTDLMSAAAQRLIGHHDFAAFASRLASPEASTVREMTCFSVTRRAERVICDVVANAFLSHQVRRMTGALVEVGRGRTSVEDFAALIDGPAASAGPAAPAQGLYLVGVEYSKEVFPGVDSAVVV